MPLYCRNHIRRDIDIEWGSRTAIIASYAECTRMCLLWCCYEYATGTNAGQTALRCTDAVRVITVADSFLLLPRWIFTKRPTMRSLRRCRITISLTLARIATRIRLSDLAGLKSSQDADNSTETLPIWHLIMLTLFDGVEVPIWTLGLEHCWWLCVRRWQALYFRTMMSRMRDSCPKDCWCNNIDLTIGGMSLLAQDFATKWCNLYRRKLLILTLSKVDSGTSLLSYLYGIIRRTYNDDICFLVCSQEV